MGDEGEASQVDQAYETGFVTQSQKEYSQLQFADPYSLYDAKAPDVIVTFAIGGSLLVVMMIMWVMRYQEKKSSVPEDKVSVSTNIRAMISAAIDNDSPVYTIVKIAAQSILFLGGIQIDYHNAFIFMLIFFTVESSLDSLRTMMCVVKYNNTKELVLTSNDLKKDIQAGSDVTSLHPTNVYEDITRVSYVVFMVFTTQFLLISFVVTDIMNSSTHSCIDGTPGCPVGGTLGSWFSYCLGIFMASVVLLGPKTNFGESEQNPAYWMQLFLSLKGSGGSYVEWKTGKKESRFLRANGWSVWIRFAMSFIINGIGFHILVFALPIQIAAQSSLTGVVFRAVGMLYLVDLDDSPGYVISFVKNPKEDEQDEQEPTETTQLLNKTALQDEANAIIKEAQEKLDSLLSSSGL